MRVQQLSVVVVVGCVGWSTVLILMKHQLSYCQKKDFGGNPIDGIWPDSLPVTCLIALQGGKASLQSLNALN